MQNVPMLPVTARAINNMKWINWKEQLGICKNCHKKFIDNVPKNFEDEKIGLSSLEYPIICEGCQRTRFYAVTKEIKSFISPEEFQKIPKFLVKRRGKKNKW